MEIQRKLLSEIVLRRTPRLLVVSAPAGYGKSTFLRQLLARVDDSAVCDCLGVRDEVDLSRAVLATLATALPALANAIAQAQLGISGDARDWEAIVFRFWSGDGPKVFVFENAEALTRSSSASVLFDRLLRLKDRTTIVCSRDTVPIPYGRGLDPTNVLTLGTDDLRFTQEEIRETLPELNDVEQSVVERISRGWPIVVALIGRAIRERPFAEVTAGLTSVLHGELLIYLVSELIEHLDPTERDLALILAALPDVTYQDIYRAWPSITLDDIDRLSMRLPVSRSNDAIRLHPMLAQLLREREGPRAVPIVRQAAEAAQAHGDDTRSAELYLSIDDECTAASVLRDLGAFIMATPTPRLAAVISRLREKTLMKYPAVWCCALMHRGYAIPPFEWLRTAEAIWNDLPENADADLRASVFSSLINGHTNIGLHDRAAELLRHYRATIGESDPCGVATLWSACLDSYDGRYDRIPEYTKILTPLLNASELTHALYLYEVISPIPRSRGEWDRDAEVLSRSRELFDSAPPMGVSLLALVESAFARWLAGDDRQCDAFVAELHERVTVANERGHRFFIACAQGFANAVPYGYEKTKTRAQALLIASARAQTLDIARHFASEAVLVSDECNRRYLRILTRCALAVLDDQRREELLDNARSLSSGLHSTPMQEAVTALQERRANVGMLAPFVARYEALRGRKKSVSVRVLRAEVLLDGNPVKLTRSEFALLIALAQAPRSFSVLELGDLLFAELDADTAGNRLYVYVHRLRQRLGRDAVLADETGYRLSAGVDVDLWRAAVSVPESTPFADFTPLSVPELEALALRLRLPEQLTRNLRESRLQVVRLQERNAEALSLAQ